ncbi:MAG: DMT family transporter [Hyphomicrobiales bacterium]|nr:DMT family transporter [Hyphomicrobiales bacterium]
MTLSKTSQDASASQATASADSPLHGVVLGLAAFLALSFMTLFAKLLSDRLNVVEIAFWRNIVALMPFAVLLAFPSQRGFLRIRSRPGIIAIRALIGTGNVVMVFGAFSLLPMANATTVLFASVLFMPVLGMIFLGEAVGPYRATAVLVGFAGVLIVVQPGAGGEDWSLVGTACALGGAFAAATLGVILRLLGQSEAPQAVTFYFLFIGMLILAPAMPFFGHVPGWTDLPYILGLGISGFLMQICMTMAFKYAPAGLIAPLNYTQIIWAMLFGWLIFSEMPTVNILGGAAIIISSSLIVIMRERYLARQGRLKRQAADETTPKNL